MAARSILFLALLPPLLTGCLGSPEAYRPGYEPRPAQITLESAEARAMRLAVPIHIEREDTWMLTSRKEIGRVMGGVPKNPWNTYEWELDDTLRPLIRNMGPEMGADRVLGRQPVKRPLPEDANPAYKSKKAEGAGEGEGEDEGDEYGDE